MPEIKRYIVNENPQQTRFLLARHMQPKYAKFLCGVLIFYFLYEWVPNFLGLIFPQSVYDYIGGNLDQALLDRLPIMPMSQFMYLLLLGGALLFGKNLYTLKYLRNNSIEYGTIMEGMSSYFRVTLIYLMQTMMISAGLMCFVLPGIYFYYAYSQALYVCAEDPHKGAIRCLAESRFMMKGNMVNLIKLDLTYLLLIVLGMSPSILIQIIGAIDPTTLRGMLVYSITRITFYTAMSHFFMGRVTFFELLRQGGFKNFLYPGEAVFREAATPEQSENAQDDK